MKHALIVGINQYDKRITTANLRGCVLDANRVLSQIFVDMPYIYLADKAATVQSVKAALTAMAENLVAGDTLYYYQSSHGTYKDFANRRATGRVMYDGVLMDYDFIAILKKFKPGVTVVTISDTCFAESNSRTAERAGMATRYIPYPLEEKTARKMLSNRASFAGVKCALVEISAAQLEQEAQEVFGHTAVENGGIFTTLLLRYHDLPSLRAIIAAIKHESRVFGQTPVLAARKVKKVGDRPLIWTGTN